MGFYMFRSQPLLRQDPAYYAFYVLLRPDHVWKLMSCPYYAKSTIPGEATAFRHIDMNILDAVETGRGANLAGHGCSDRR